MNAARFYWWDDAVAYARKRAAATGRRHTVRRVGAWYHLAPWAVAEVEA